MSFRLAAFFLGLMFSFSAQAQESGVPGDTGTYPNETDMIGCLYQADLGTGTPEGCIGVISNPCFADAVSTVEMIACVEPEYQFWDGRLNETYQEVRGVLAEQDMANDDNYVLKTRLQSVQKTWISWRDSKCGFEYDRFRGGTIGRTISASCRMEETAKRVFELEDLLAELRM